MREIRYTNRFKRDYKREKAGRHGTGNQTTIISSSCVSVHIASLVCRRSVPDDQQDEATLVWRQECVATIRRAELTDGETSMTAANDLAVRRALELAGTDPS
jgi:hypothetical protein